MATQAFAHEISGSASAIDGDSLDMAGISIRLHGVDAPEYRQSCERGGQSWACGREAADRLRSLVRGAHLRCEQHDIDRHGRIVAVCRAVNIDLGGEMIDAGLAVALPQYSDRYAVREARARAARLGIWGAQFQMPADYRAAHAPRPPKVRPLGKDAGPSAGSRPAGAYYPNCHAARAAGAAPLYRGRPGYRPEMDGDGDGVACEPYRGL